MRSAALAVAGLTLTYALTLASFHPLDLVVGAGLSLVLLAGLRTAPVVVDVSPGHGFGRRLLGFPVFVAALLFDVAAGTWDVALRVAHLRALERPGIVVIPMQERTALGVAVSALAMTLSPGSVFVDLDWRRRIMLLHVIDASNPAAVRAHHRHFYERYQRPVFP